MTEEVVTTEAAATTTEGADVSQQAQSGATAAPETEQQQTETKPAEAVYEFTAPEGREFDAEVITNFTEVVKDAGVPPESAQKILDKMAPILEARGEKALSTARQQWASEAMADGEYGGAKFDESMATAKKALDTFGSEKFNGLLKATGLENHPEVIRTFFSIGKAISEDKFVSGGGGNATGGAQRLYSASKMNP